MFALVATSMAGASKKEKRGVLGLGASFDAGYSSYAGKIFSIETLLTKSNNMSFYSSIAGYQSPVFQAAPYYQPAVHPVVPVQHTHSVQRITENFPVHAYRTIVKTVPVDRPIPQVMKTFPFVTHSFNFSKLNFIFIFSHSQLLDM